MHLSLALGRHGTFLDFCQWSVLFLRKGDSFGVSEPAGWSLPAFPTSPSELLWHLLLLAGAVPWTEPPWRRDRRDVRVVGTQPRVVEALGQWSSAARPNDTPFPYRNPSRHPGFGAHPDSDLSEGDCNLELPGEVSESQSALQEP